MFSYKSSENDAGGSQRQFDPKSIRIELDAGIKDLVGFKDSLNSTQNSGTAGVLMVDPNACQRCHEAIQLLYRHFETWQFDMAQLTFYCLHTQVLDRTKLDSLSQDATASERVRNIVSTLGDWSNFRDILFEQGEWKKNHDASTLIERFMSPNDKILYIRAERIGQRFECALQLIESEVHWANALVIQALRRCPNPDGINID